MRALPGVALLVAAAQACNVTLNKLTHGHCDYNNAFGCAPSHFGPNSMYAQFGCGGIFTCDGYTNVTCVSPCHHCFVQCPCGPIPSTPPGTYYVDGKAPPGGDGSKSRPWNKIQTCLDYAAESKPTMSQCHVAAGRYRENLVWYEGVELFGDGAGKTFIDGTDPIPAAVKWQPPTPGSQGQVWTAQIPEWRHKTIKQIFVDDEFISEARYPDASFDQILNVSTWGVMQDGSTPGTLIDPGLIDAVRAGGKGGIEGAVITLNIGNGVFSLTTYMTSTCLSPDQNCTFNITLLQGYRHSDYKGCRYFVSGAEALLDAPGEWIWYPDQAVLKVWAPDGKSPAGRVSVKNDERRVCLTAGRCDYPQKLHDITVWGCAAQYNNCSRGPGYANGCHVHDVDFIYPTYDNLIIDRMYPHSAPVTPPTLFLGGDALIERVRMMYSNNWGFYVTGSNNILREMLLDSIDWIGSLDYGPIRIGWSLHNPAGGPWNAALGMKWVRGEVNELGEVPSIHEPAGNDNLIERVTIRNFGNSGIITSQKSNEVRLAHVYQAGLIGGDDSAIHADNARTLCNWTTGDCIKHWHHIWVHNAREKCVRCDDRSVYCYVNNAVVFNCGQPLITGNPAGLILKGWNHSVYANTLWNVSHGQGAFVPRTKWTQMNGSSFWNIAAERETNGGGLPLSDHGPNKTSDFVEGNNFTFTDADQELEDPWNFKFRPKPNSVLIGKGVTHGPVTTAGDIGAYQLKSKGPHPLGPEYNDTDWRPGCTFHPDCFKHVQM
eukprot:TRINITY_DN3088_c0_g1_i1.p1 TRINITY_DN3088_c0_g1~~TRINITY_DN3088_c0_g1_i1.p1  ORF type:complete len:807 (+),score=266.29 TRINITY_DN3088_c0_g1_i1:113-2422(+)